MLQLTGHSTNHSTSICSYQSGEASTCAPYRTEEMLITKRDDKKENLW
jgi:hypothetical protein